MARSRTCAVCGCTEDAACHDELRGNCWQEGDRLCSHCAQPDGRRARALVTAGQLAEVVAELLLFVREGDDRREMEAILDTYKCALGLG